MSQPTLSEVAAYLLGEGTLDGYWFHEAPYDRPLYWWREHLRAALVAEPEGVGCTDLAELVKEARVLIARYDADTETGRP